ncbi:uncharacterized protein LOC117229715 isoform X2 [Megalopta genalis]|uniref:uncharacterized protein LOC117229715 isoform X2 n=1 Tax=Megalopta genalis TaxID=115081 RepID=UPI003FD3B5D4
MENQGFEEEHQPGIPPAEQSFALPRIDFVGHASASHVADGHVYEDILPGIESVTRISIAADQRPSSDEQPSQPEGDRISRAATTTTTTTMLEQDELSCGFRRNLTLPFRRSGGLDPAGANSSVRVTSREKSSWHEEAETAGNAETIAPSIEKDRDARQQPAEARPNRRRRKKDCKHCRSKAVASTYDRDCEIDERENEEEIVSRKNRDNKQRQFPALIEDPRTILDPCDLAAVRTYPPIGNNGDKQQHHPARGTEPLCVFTITEKPAASPKTQPKLIELEDPRGKEVNKPVLAQEKSRAGMRVNSIYSQDRWYAKEAPIFCTDVKEHGSFQISDYRGTSGEKGLLEENAVPMAEFQRAYSLPVRTQTPSSQNRANQRRSVRAEPPPHPARLRKHRHGWTLHLARPLKTSGCSRSLVLVLLLILALLGIGAIALYIVFEPEKLQIIQQYLKSSANDSSTVETPTAGTLSMNASSTTTTTPVSSSSMIATVLLSGDQSFPESGARTTAEPEAEASSPPAVNSTRYCDDCLNGEVCVALVDEEVPICRTGLDLEDPTGCAGFCLVNKQKCHRLDVDAFRCVEVEHYCLDDEWTCANTLCIPLEKRCDGHMNCYDHSDEFNCECDPETHFQCGNETSCLPLEKRCDGKIDCWDAADEINCTLGGNLGWSCPSKNEFTCSDGQCISEARFCDGLPDCVDGSDEPSGCQGRCNKHEFTCQNNRCITKGMKCNGVDDCGDGTDERHCKHRIL